jgi:hypothetical protein
VRIGSAEGILAVVPHLLGFRPANSLVMLGIGGPHARVRLAFRYDLPDPPDNELAADIAEHAVSVLGRQHLAMAVAVGYGPGTAVTPVMDVVAPALREAGVGIQDMLRVEGGRYWSYVCQTPNAARSTARRSTRKVTRLLSPSAAACFDVLADRAELAGTLAPLAEAAAPMRAAVARRGSARGN